MTTRDIFMTVVVISGVLGILLLSTSYVAVAGITSLVNATANIPSYTPQSFFSGGIAIANILPIFAVILVVVMIIFAWMLSAFIKASILGAAVSIVWMIVYTVIALFMSHYLVSAARVSIFIQMGNGANLLFLFWANMPVILVFASVIDIAIAVLAYRKV